jgi:hypothetical protein
MFWRVFERVDPLFEGIGEDVKAQYQRIVRWEESSFTWTLDDGGDAWKQETWESVHFDRVSFESLIAELRDRSNAGALQGFEIDEWIRTECSTENSKLAWTSFKSTFGDRTGKRDPTFRDAWTRVKGERTRGRLPNSQ